jgi:ABC-type transport system involved in cytochrome c biogenesis permease component
MTLLPVVGRELRVASRRPWSYWGRSASAGAAVLVCAWVLLFEHGTKPTQLGATVFAVTSFIAYAYALLAGVVHCADALASERRDGTLGLLFLTDLKGHDVLLGKLAANSLGAVMKLAAALPILALSMLLGGVSFPEYSRLILALLSSLFLSLSVGMFASTLSEDSKRAAVWALLLILAVCGLVPGLGGLAIWAGHAYGIGGPELSDWWLSNCSWATPVSLYFRADDDLYGTRVEAERFWWGLALGWVVTLGFLAWASVRVPTLWQIRSGGTERRTWRQRIEGWRWPTETARTAFRTRLLEDGPLVWLAGRHWGRGVAVWMFLALVTVVFLGVGLLVGKDWFDVPTYMTTSLLVHFIFKFWIAGEAPRQFMDDRRSGAMELLLSSPLKVEELIHGRMRALRRQFELPGLVILAADLVFLAAGTEKMGSGDSEWVFVWLARMGLFILDGYSLASTGVWHGMKTRGQRGTLPVWFRIVGLPWLVVLGFATLAALLAMGGGLGGLGFTGSLVIWFMIGAVNDALWLARSHQDLAANFRSYALTRPGEKARREGEAG